MREQFFYRFLVLKEKLKDFTPSQFRKLFLSLLFVAAIPFTLFAVQQRQEIRQRASAGQECVETVLPPSGMAGTNPATGGYYQPSVAVMGGRIYVFLIGEGGKREGEPGGKPTGDWYNLFMRSGYYLGGEMVWTDFTNLRGILASTVETYVDDTGLHVYVYGYDYEAGVPNGSRYHMLIRSPNDYDVWGSLDGNEDYARQHIETLFGGNDFRFSTDGGPLSGCKLGSVPTPTINIDPGDPGGGDGSRANVPDRGDDFPDLYQFKPLYVVTSDHIDRKADINGTIRTSIDALQYKFGRMTNSYQVRFDTYNGDYDIGFIRLDKTDDQMVNGNYQINIQNELARHGYDTNLYNLQNNNKRYLVYYDGDLPGACGFSLGIYGGGLEAGGSMAVAGLRNCGNTFPSSDRDPGQLESVAIHELLHALGAVSPDAPHFTVGAHIGTPNSTESEYDQPRDIMYQGNRPRQFAEMDLNNDDYYKVTAHYIQDVADSRFIYKALLEGLSCVPFIDVCDYNDETKKAITCLSEKYGVVKGYTNGAFGGEDIIVRGTYVAFLVRYRVNVLKDQEWVNDYNSIDAYYDGLPEANSGAPFGQKKFSDVDKSNPLWKEIYLSQKKGFIFGYTDGEFKPYEKWFYGFHGITRDDDFRGERYNFLGASEEDQRGISRAAFITKLYQYSRDKYQDKISQCSQ